MVKEDKNQDLLGEKGGMGFPHLVFMDKSGNVLSTVEGERSIEGFEEAGKKAQAYVDLKKKAESGDKAAKIEVLIADLGAGRVGLDAAEKDLTGLGELTPAQKKSLDEARSAAANKEVMDVLKSIKGESQEQQEKEAVEAGKKLWERKKAGKPIPSGEMEFQYHWILIMKYAEHEKNAAVFEESLTALKGKFGDKPEAKDFFDKQEKILEGLKGGKKDDAPKKEEGGGK